MVQLFFTNVYRPQGKGGMLALLCTLTLTNSCMVVGPDYTPPQTKSDLGNWKSARQTGVDTDTPALDEPPVLRTLQQTLSEYTKH